MRLAPLPLLLLLLLLPGCADSTRNLPPPPENVLIEGRITETDVTPMFVDGDGLIFANSTTYGKLIIRIPARIHLCPAAGLSAFPSLAPGDTIRLYGKVTAENTITVCEDETHFLEKME